MTVGEVITELEKFPADMTVLVEDGMSISDPCPVKRVQLTKDRFTGEECVEIDSK